MMNTTLEMNFARNILNGIMSNNHSLIIGPFLNVIEEDKHDFKNYYKIIKEPICLNQIKAKMDESEYQNIKEFICDFRLMLFNCYRYFGCDSKNGKLAAKLESMFEQKLILLPIDIRLKTSLDAILMDETQSEFVQSGTQRRRCTDRAFSNDIRLVTPIKSMMDELEKFGTISTMFSDNSEFQNDPINFFIEKLHKWQDKRRNQQFIRNFDDWFSANISETDCQVLSSCSEFVQFVQFISAAFQGLGLDLMLEEHLKLTHITFVDLEYAILFPKTSSLLSALVPLITTTSKNRQSVLKSGLFEYDAWNKEITERVGFLYKQWHERGFSEKPDFFVKRYSVDPVLFKVLGKTRPITDKKQMHELTVFQRCHVLLALCCMVLRLQDTIHFAMDRSIEWDDHRIVLLAQVGRYEYVRFAGLGEFASFFVYRIEKREIDSELADYCVQNLVDLKADKRKKKEKLPDKYRMPIWFKAEQKKSKTKKPVTTVVKKNKPNVIDTKVNGTRRSSRYRKQEDEVVDNDVDVNNSIPDKVDDVEIQHSNLSAHEVNGLMIHSSTTSVLTNEDDVTLDACTDPQPNQDQDYTPDIIAPKPDEFQIVARDLAGIMAFISEIANKIETKDCSDEELQGYKELQEKMKEIQEYFEINEANRKEKLNQSRLALRQEIDRAEKKAKYPKSHSPPSASKSVEASATEEKLSSHRYTESRSSDSEYETTTTSDRYTESECYSVATSTQITRAERLARRRKRQLSDTDTDINPTKRLPRQEVAPPATENNLTHHGRHDTPVTPTPQHIKKKVYRICDDYFTEDLEPVHINDDGTLVHLSRELITDDRYELARKMIAMYKLKTEAVNSRPAPPTNGTLPIASSS